MNGVEGLRKQGWLLLDPRLRRDDGGEELTEVVKYPG